VKLVLGTRGSALALWQARHVAALLCDRHPGLEITERIIKTEGDLQQTEPLVGSDVGVFVRRIEQYLLDGAIDFAVHSLKDLPTEQPDGLCVAAVPSRHDPRDALLSPEGFTFQDLPSGTRIGTGSPRRRTQLLNARPDLRTSPVRGNVDTRIRKLAEGDFGAIVLALAGLERLEIDHVPYRPIEPAVCLPAVGQGALAIETRSDDERARSIVNVLDDPASHGSVAAERAFLHELGGGCLAPATAYASHEGQQLVLRAVVGDPDGVEVMRDDERGPANEAVEIGRRLARRMGPAGATRLLEESRAEARRRDRR